MNDIIEYKNIRKGILKNIKIQIKKNKITSITGSNSSGKSTLANYLNSKLDNNIFITDDISDFSDLTVKNYILSVLESKKEFTKIKKQFHLNELLNSNVDKISIGQKQLIKVITALLSNKEIIILDDALSDIDTLQKEKLFRLLKKSSKTIINITNDVEELVFGDYVILLNDGKIILSDQTKKALIKEKEFKECNLDLPFMASLSLKLKYYDLIDELYLDMNKLVNRLWK